MTTPTTMLFDGDCGLCTAAAAWLTHRARTGDLRVMPLQHVAEEPDIAHLVAGRDLSSTLHVLTPAGTVRTGAAAVLAVARLVPRWGAVARLVDHRVGRTILEPVYQQVAAHRHRIGRTLRIPTACVAPSSPLR